QRAENNQKIYKKDNFYIISIEIVFFSLIQELYVPDSCYYFWLPFGPVLYSYLDGSIFLKSGFL
ncbi:hypothetical protein QVA46_07870, partial [Staphylococcus haemolyticus]